ncbi:hypothetical protein Droror1_Dr00022791 [Drosera rotundifolia]
MEEQERPPPPPPPPQTLTLILTKHDEFLRSLSRIAVSQVCETRGFHAIHRSALDALSDLAIRYAFDASKQGVRYAELSGRREPNVVDLIRGIEELGFEGGSGGVVVGEIWRFVELEAEVPFVYSIPRVPVCKKSKVELSFVGDVLGDEKPGDHVPSWLPVYPNESTYVNVKENGDRIEEKEMKGELLSNVVQGQARTSERMNEMGGGSKVAEVNPYLAPAFRYGEKEVAVVVFPSKLSEEGYVMNEGLLRDSEVGKGDVVGSEDGEEATGGVEKRPRVQFKLSSCSTRKRLGAVVRNEVQESAVYFDVEDKKDAERLAKVIIKKSVEIAPQPSPL